MAAKKIKTPVKEKVQKESDKEKEFVELVLKNSGALNAPKKSRYGYYENYSLESIISEGYLSDAMYDILDQVVIDANQVLTEQGVFDILKNNKKLQEKFDQILKDLAMSIVDETDNVAKEFERTKKEREIREKKQAEYEAKNKIALAKQQEAMEKKLKKQQEAKKKLAAEKAMFKESLTGKQKLFIKKLLNFDVNKI